MNENVCPSETTQNDIAIRREFQGKTRLSKLAALIPMALIFLGASDTLSSDALPLEITKARSESTSVVSWDGPGQLQVASKAEGPWETVEGAKSPYSVNAKEASLFFRLMPVDEDLGDPNAADTLAKADFMESLKSVGAVVSSGENIRQPFFDVEGQLIAINEQQIQLFAFSGPEEVEAVKATISADGNTVGLSMIFWIEPPHFFRKGNLIVLYVGNNESTLTLLGTVMGPQFAGQ